MFIKKTERQGGKGPDDPHPSGAPRLYPQKVRRGASGGLAVPESTDGRALQLAGLEEDLE